MNPVEKRLHTDMQYLKSYLITFNLVKLEKQKRDARCEDNSDYEYINTGFKIKCGAVVT